MPVSSDNTEFIKNMVAPSDEGKWSEPACYESLESRFLPLDGDWVKHVDDETSTTNNHHFPYWNLSCPFEFSKYSCVQQEKYEQAIHAATTRFHPRHCRFATSRGSATLADVLKGRRVVLFGDSLLRQIHISLGCILHSRGVVVNSNVEDIPWPNCSVLAAAAAFGKKRTKAQEVDRLNSCPDGLVNCRLCGPHSSVHKDPIVIHLGQNASLSVHYFKDSDLNTLTERDVLIIEAGAHGGDKVTTKILRRKIGNYVQNQQENRPILIHVVTWSSHFAIESGKYQPSLLEARKLAGESLLCRSSVPSDRMSMELEVMGEPKWVIQNTTSSLLDLFSGVIWLNGTNDQGLSKVGQGGGPYSDCQHFCQPGPPDEFARALETMLLQVLVSESTTSANIATYADTINGTNDLQATIAL